MHSPAHIFAQAITNTGVCSRGEARIGDLPPFSNTYLDSRYFCTTFFALGTSKTLFGSDFELYLICVKVHVRVSPDV
jgi:hypothetical protein